MIINGQKVDAAGMILKEYLEREGYCIARIAVERNDKIVPKSQYGSIVLTENDVLEIVSFVGGG